MNLTTILIADDDPKILKGLSGFLNRKGFRIFTATNGEDVLGLCNTIEPDIIILDIMMPKLDGFEACRKIREGSNVPIIFLSARSEITDKILGFTLGSDDYLTKPFDNDELLYRIKAVLRRSSNPRTLENSLISLPQIQINRSSRTVEVQGKRMELTPKEFDLLWLLTSQPERVWTREQLLHHIWETAYYEDTGLINSLIRRLRDKIEPEPAKPIFIKTVRGVGYRFEMGSDG